MLMGNGGYAAAILRAGIARGEHIVACCMRRAPRPAPLAGVRAVGRSLIRRFPNSAPDAFVYRDPFHGMPTPYAVATHEGIPVIDAAALRTPAFLDALRGFAPDVLLVAGFHRLIPPTVLAVPARACVNFHPSLLPKHRGGTPNRWVVRNGETETGVTAHLLSERFDTGDVVAQESIAVPDGATWGDVEVRIAAAMPRVAERVLDAIAAGRLHGVPQREADATYEPPFHGALQEIDWTLPAMVVRRTCNAMRPKSGGLTALGGRRWCCWEVDLQWEQPRTVVPGTITGFDGGGNPIVACGAGSVVIRSVLIGGRIQRAAPAFRRAGVVVGQRFTVASSVLCAS